MARSKYDGIKNAVYVTKKIMAEFNLKDYQAVGWGGCWLAESGCDPHNYNKAEKAGTFKKSAANGPGYGAGMGQWSMGWKKRIQNFFKRYTPIETWSIDLQIDIVLKMCKPAFINMVRGAKNAAEATDYILRGYENGSGGTTTELRSKESMKAYTWCKTVEIPDVGIRTYPDGYQGALAERVAWSLKTLKAMGNYSDADLQNLGSYSGGGYDESGNNGGNVQYVYGEAYPVHEEYDTYTGTGGNIFENYKENAFSQASLYSTNVMSSKSELDSTNKHIHTRIYSTNDSLIVLDELKLPNGFENENYSNKGITEEYVKEHKYEGTKLKKEENPEDKKDDKDKKDEEDKKEDKDKK